MEFKRLDVGEMPEQMLKQALNQLDERHYAADLQAAGVASILKLAIVFRGKELWVKQLITSG
jgi:hypothetical protein